MANTVGPLIKEARGKAKLSQEALASQIDGLSATDLSKAERGEKELSQSVLRQIAKITGVTQSSLVNAAKESTYGSTAAAKKTGTSASSKKTAPTSTAKKTSASTTAAKKTASSSTAKKTSTSTAAAKKTDDALTSAEKKLVELYRAADAETKKKAVAVLKGEQTDTGDILTTLLGSAMDMFGKK